MTFASRSVYDPKVLPLPTNNYNTKSRKDLNGPIKKVRLNSIRNSKESKVPKVPWEAREIGRPIRNIKQSLNKALNQGNKKWKRHSDSRGISEGEP